MSVTFAGGLTSETPIAPRELLRATFGTTVWAVGSDRAVVLRSAYDRLGNSLGSSGLGYLASPKAIGPDAEVMTLDIRRSITGQPTAAAIASTLQDLVGTPGPDKVELTRLARVPAGEGSSAAQEDRQDQTNQEAAKPSLLDQLLTKARAVGVGFIVVLVIAALLLLAYLLH